MTGPQAERLEPRHGIMGRRREGEWGWAPDVGEDAVGRQADRAVAQLRASAGEGEEGAVTI